MILERGLELCNSDINIIVVDMISVYTAYVHKAQDTMSVYTAFWQAHKAQDIGSSRGKLSVEDFLYLIQKDVSKLNRFTELLCMEELLKQARKAFEVDEEKLTSIE